MKKTIAFLTAFLFSLNIFSDNPVIVIPGDDVPPPGENTNPRSLNSVSATIDCNIITVYYDILTASQITVSDSSGQTVFYQSYNESYSVQANLTNLPAGSYTLYIYAYGIWWHGTFAIE